MRHRSEAGKWRRIGALRTLVRARHPRSQSLLRRAIRDGDPDIAGAAARALGELGTEWAIDELVGALRRGDYPRSRIAAQLERFRPTVGARLVPLLGDRHGAVRFWAATLLAQCPEDGREELVLATQDTDANVRAAAVEALGTRRDRAALAVVRPRLLDEAWFVRVHACRAVGELGTLDEASRVARLLGDPWWWVRAAAKDALRSQGIAIAGALIPLLDDGDGFVRNGAAEVLQDVGFVDALVTGGRDAALLERIFTAGGETMRAAALRRAGTRRARPSEAAIA
jgi:HEAT repeat protein